MLIDPGTLYQQLGVLLGRVLTKSGSMSASL